jgi:hypothetical protein
MRRRVIFGGIIGGLLAVVLTLGAVLTVVTARSAPPSDEEQIRAVLTGMEDSYNRSDYAGFASHLCADMRADADFELGWHERRADDGRVDITVNSVDVTGDDAVANVEFAAANHDEPKTLDMDFLRQETEWKACL